jgi:hypothetical protein
MTQQTIKKIEDYLLESTWINKNNQDEIKSLIIEIEKEFDVKVKLEIVKEAQLQYTWFFNLTKNNKTLSITIEDGINNGTEIVYSDFSKDDNDSPKKEQDVLVDIEFDWYRYYNWLETKSGKKTIPESFKEAILDTFNREKPKIMELLSNVNYDSWLLGGRAIAEILIKQDNHYKKVLDKYRERGCFWKKIYSRIECDKNFIFSN